MGLLADYQKAAPGAQIELFIIDFTTTGLPAPPATMFLYSGVAVNYGDLVFGGNTYSPFPMQVEGIKQTTDGPLPRPVATVSNVTGFMSDEMLRYNDFIGAKVTRYQTLAKYLDGEPDSDPNARTTDIYFIEQKKSENPLVIELVLVTAIDAMDAKLPARIMLTNACMWEYKETECGWPGTDPGLYFDASDNPVVDQADDVCSKSLVGCKRRYCAWDGSKYTVPRHRLLFSGFPSLGRTK